MEISVRTFYAPNSGLNPFGGAIKTVYFILE